MNKFSPLIVFLFFTLLVASCASKQGKKSYTEVIKADSRHKYPKEYDSTIYVGTVLGINADAYNKEGVFRRDTIYGLGSLTKSNHQVEIRFYTQSYGYDTSYATILTYDTLFKISRVKHYTLYDTTDHNFENGKSFNLPIPVKTNPDSIFFKLIENGIFSLVEMNKEDYRRQNVKELTKNGLKKGTYIGDVMDGTDFILEYKVDTFYNRIFMNSPHIYFEHNPDYQLFRRYYEITSLLFSGFE